MDCHPAWVHGIWLGTVCVRALDPWGAVMNMTRLTVRCGRDDCFGNVNGMCIVLQEQLTKDKRGINCPFWKTQKRMDAELDALDDEDWDAFHRAQHIR